MNIGHFFARRPVFAWVIAILIILFGIISSFFLGMEQYPSVAPGTVVVSSSYRGANAETVENSVTSVIEREMFGIEGLLYMQSSSSDAGLSSTTLTFSRDRDLDIAMVDTQNNLNSATPRLPPEVRQQGIKLSKTTSGMIALVGFTSPNGTYDRFEIANYIDNFLLDRLKTIDGVGGAQLFGNKYSMRIWLDIERMTYHKIGVNEVIQVITEENADFATGSLGRPPILKEDNLITLSVITDGKMSFPEEFENIVVKSSSNGAFVKLKDIAEVEIGAAFYDFVGELNRKPTAFVAFNPRPDANTIEVVDRIRAYLEAQSQYLPDDFEWEISYDTSIFIEKSVYSIITTFILAVILVSLITLFFLKNVRFTLVPVIVIPISLIGTLTILLILGYSLNTLTLFALILAIGSVVDDAIVVVENVDRLMRDEKLSAMQATLKSMTQVSGALVSTTAVMCAVFLPMVFISGSIGVIYRQFAVTISIALVFSTVLALVLAPALCATLLSKLNPDDITEGYPRPYIWFLSKFDKVIDGSKNYYTKILPPLIAHYKKIILIFLMVIAGFVYWLSSISSGFLPDEDKGYFVVMVNLSSQASLSSTQSINRKIEDILLGRDDVKSVTTINGFGMFGENPNVATLFVVLEDWSKREYLTKVMGEVNQALATKITGATAFAVNLPSIPGLGSVGGVELKLQDRASGGRDFMFKNREHLLRIANEHPHIQRAYFQGLDSTPKLFLNINREKAKAIGISTAELMKAVQVFWGSYYINDFSYNGINLPVIAQAKEEYRVTPDDIAKIMIKSSRSQEMIPLSSVATLEWTASQPVLERFDGFPSLSIGATAKEGFSTGDVIKAFENDLLPQLDSGIGYEWAGQTYEEIQSSGQIFWLLLFSSLMIFLILAALYENWSIPFSVLLSIPLAIVGIVIGIVFRGYANDIYVKIGLITALGLSAKNAILIVEFAKQLEAEEKLSIAQAAFRASILRFRPLMMTALSFIIGTLPLAFGGGLGAESRQIVGTVMLSGISVSTFLGLIVVPCSYTLIRKIASFKQASS